VNRHLIYGPPGTGKTTRLLELVNAEIARGVAPEEIAYLAFTRRAAREARERASLSDPQLRHFRTIHSFCFKALGLSSDRMMARARHGRAFAELMGMSVPEDGEWRTLNADDRALFIEEQSRVRCLPLQVMYEQFHEMELSYWQVERAARALLEYKTQFDTLDFTDVLALFLEQGQVPPLRVLFVDEAQDLSPLQWRVVQHLERHTERSYMAGDDDQAIFAWAGADVAHYMKLRGEPEYLGYSYRVPSAVQLIALGVLEQITQRVPKSWEPRKAVGEVLWEPEVDVVDMSAGSWLVLCRNAHFLNEAARHCRYSGWWYEWRDQPAVEPEVIEAIMAWERWGRYSNPDDWKVAARMMGPAHRETHPEPAGDRKWYDALDRIPAGEREYIRAMRRNGEKLLERPRIRLSTIHAAKGGEADNVLLLTDMTRRSWEGLVEDPDAEHRVFYVATTRARERLLITAPQSRYSYDLV
jgi:DNA helicase-2/ATP-dependent DNA helicase PcrA